MTMQKCTSEPSAEIMNQYTWNGKMPLPRLPQELKHVIHKRVLGGHIIRIIIAMPEGHKSTARHKRVLVLSHQVNSGFTVSVRYAKLTLNGVDMNLLFTSRAILEEVRCMPYATNTWGISTDHELRIFL